MTLRNHGFSILILLAFATMTFVIGHASGQVKLQSKPVTAQAGTIYIPPIVQRSLRLSNGGAPGSGTGTIYRVPTGKRLKIEQVSGHIEATRGEMLPALLVRTTAGSVTADHEIDLGEPHVPLSEAGSHFYYFTLPTAIYAEAGSDVVILVGRGGGGGVYLNQFAISGRLESM